MRESKGISKLHDGFFWLIIQDNDFCKGVIIMKSTLSRMAVVVIAMWLGFAAGTANATVQTINNWNNDGGGFSANFGNNVLTSFEDSIHFSLPKVGSSNYVSLTHDGGTSLEAFDLWGDGNMLSSGLIGSSDSHLSFLGDSNIKDFELRFKGHNYSGGGS